jgi:hypothetical protein
MQKGTHGDASGIIRDIAAMDDGNECHLRTIDDNRACGMRHCEAVLCFMERDIIFPSMILFQAIGHFAKRLETKNKSHLQANQIVGSAKPYNANPFVELTDNKRWIKITDP